MFDRSISVVIYLILIYVFDCFSELPKLNCSVDFGEVSVSVELRSLRFDTKCVISYLFEKCNY